MTIKLIVGLGNPGAQYAQTRHNAGEWFVRAIADKFAGRFAFDNKYKGDVAMATIAGEQVRLLVPHTFMNLSGHAVAPLANFFRIAPEEMLVAHDELDIPPGTLKLKIGGGNGGHNGLKDIQACLGNNPNFYRLRIGIGHPGAAPLVSGWVLSKAPSSEQQKIDAALDDAVKCVELLVKADMQQAQHKLHNVKH